MGDVTSTIYDYITSTSGIFPTDKCTYSEDENVLPIAEKLHYGYGQTKWVAEQIVMAASRNGLPTIISRYLET